MLPQVCSAALTWSAPRGANLQAKCVLSVMNISKCRHYDACAVFNGCYPAGKQLAFSPAIFGMPGIPIQSWVFVMESDPRSSHFCQYATIHTAISSRLSISILRSTCWRIYRSCCASMGLNSTCAGDIEHLFCCRVAKAAFRGCCANWLDCHAQCHFLQGCHARHRWGHQLSLHWHERH